MSSIKINRALRNAAIGACPGSADDMLDIIPARAVAKLTSLDLAELLDATWQACQRAKALGRQDDIANGCIWDARAQVHRDIARAGQ